MLSVNCAVCSMHGDSRRLRMWIAGETKRGVVFRQQPSSMRIKYPLGDNHLAKADLIIAPQCSVIGKNVNRDEFFNVIAASAEVTFIRDNKTPRSLAQT